MSETVVSNEELLETIATESKSSGWPCHSFINDSFYRRLGLGKDVRISKEGIVILVMKKGKYTFISRSWDQLMKLRNRKVKK